MSATSTLAQGTYWNIHNFAVVWCLPQVDTDGRKKGAKNDGGSFASKARCRLTTAHCCPILLGRRFLFATQDALDRLGLLGAGMLIFPDIQYLGNLCFFVWFVWCVCFLWPLACWQLQGNRSQGHPFPEMPWPVSTQRSHQWMRCRKQSSQMSSVSETGHLIWLYL